MRIIINDHNNKINPLTYIKLIETLDPKKLYCIRLIDKCCTDHKLLDQLLTYKTNPNVKLELEMSFEHFDQTYLNKVLYYKDVIGLNPIVNYDPNIIHLFNDLVTVKLSVTEDMDFDFIKNFKTVELLYDYSISLEKMQEFTEVLEDQVIFLNLSKELIPCKTDDDIYMKLNVISFRNESNNLMEYAVINPEGDVLYEPLNKVFLTNDSIKSFEQIQKVLVESFEDDFRSPLKKECILCGLYRTQHKKCY